MLLRVISVEAFIIHPNQINSVMHSILSKSVQLRSLLEASKTPCAEPIILSTIRNTFLSRRLRSVFVHLCAWIASDSQCLGHLQQLLAKGGPIPRVQNLTHNTVILLTPWIFMTVSDTRRKDRMRLCGRFMF